MSIIQSRSIPPIAPAKPAARSGWPGVVLVALAVFLFVQPTLSRVPFSGSMENLNVATVMELRRGGPWLIPHLEGADRVNKPPLTAWITAMNVPASLIAKLDSVDGAARDAAYAELAGRIRIVALIETCITILLIGGIARSIGIGPGGMFVAAASYGTCLLVLRLGRAATTDVLLTMWIAAAMLGLAVWLFLGRRWIGTILVGVTSGLAFMTKGPVGLLYILLAPAMVSAIRAWWRSQAAIESGEPSNSSTGPHAATRLAAFEPDSTESTEFNAPLLLEQRGKSIAPILVALFLAGMIGLPWYVYVFTHQQHVMAGWATEVTTIKTAEEAKTRPFVYVFIAAMIVPWLGWAAAGVWGGWRELRSRRASAVLWLALMAVVPLTIMSFFPDRKDRYALPAMLPLAVLGGWVFASASDRLRHSLVNLQLILVTLAAIGGPISANVFAKTLAGEPWLSPGAAAGWLINLGLLAFSAWQLRTRYPMAFASITLLIMLFTQSFATDGYALSHDGRSEMKPLAEAIRAAGYGHAETLNGRPNHSIKRVPVDLAIYLNHPTLQVRDWDSLPPADHPRVAIVPQGHREPAPVPPPGWRAIAKTPRDSDWWWAFVQEPVGSK